MHRKQLEFNTMVKRVPSDPAATHGLWADLHQPTLPAEEADIVILGIPYDGAASARKGTSLGPERIRSPFMTRSGTSRPFGEKLPPCRALRSCWVVIIR
jgi:hypothetical protein